MKTPITVEFPLAGEWLIGADGTEAGHERAFDFLRVDKKLKASRRAAWRELFQAVPLEEYYAWGQPMLAPFHGTVLAAIDGGEEIATSYLRTLINTLFSKQGDAELQQLLEAGAGDIRHFAGNHVILQSAEDTEVYAFLAHARKGSVCVTAGQQVEHLQKLAEVGNSGQSMTPHLHFQLMNQANPINAETLECRFRAYEVLVNGHWEKCELSVPKRRQRIRAVG